MEYTILFHPKAETEFLNAYLWYEELLEGLGERFSNAVENQIKLISKNPEHYQLRKKDCRESRTKIFPYLIVFKLYKNRKEILVVAIYHTSRTPSKKYSK